MHLLNIKTATAAIIAFSLASCKPDKAVVPADNTMESIVTPIQLPIVDNVYGALFAIKLVQIFNGVEEKSELASAEFYNSPSNTATATDFANAGIVSVNNIALNQNQQTNTYDKMGANGHIFTSLNFDEGVGWVVEGDDGIPAGTSGWSHRFATYSGVFPSVITRKDGLSLTFDEHTIVDADSVFVAISAGDKLIVKRYGAYAGKVTIPAEELMQLQACTPQKPGYLQITPAMVVVFPVAERPTAIAKETVEIRTVIIR